MKCTLKRSNYAWLQFPIGTRPLYVIAESDVLPPGTTVAVIHPDEPPVGKTFIHATLGNAVQAVCTMPHTPGATTGVVVLDIFLLTTPSWG